MARTMLSYEGFYSVRGHRGASRLAHAQAFFGCSLGRYLQGTPERRSAPPKSTSCAGLSGSLRPRLRPFPLALTAVPRYRSHSARIGTPGLRSPIGSLRSARPASRRGARRNGRSRGRFALEFPAARPAPSAWPCGEIRPPTTLRYEFNLTGF